MDGNILTKNFTELNKSELIALAKSLGLSMSYQHISICQKHYRDKNYEGMPTTEELKILDVIAKNYPLSDITHVLDVIADDKEIADTLYDLYSKAKCLDVFNGAPLSFSELIEIPEKYFDRIGIHAPSVLPHDEDTVSIENECGEILALFSNKADTFLRYGYVSENAKQTEAILEKDTAFLLIGKAYNEPSEAFSEKLSTLFCNSEFNKKTSYIKKISNECIFDALMSLSKGLLIDLDHLPLRSVCEKKLSFITETVEDYYVIATKPETTNYVINTSISHGLSVCFIAKKISTDNIFLHIDGETKLFENPFSSISSTKNSLKIEKETFLPTEYKQELVVNIDNENRPFPGKYIRLPSCTATALMCEYNKNGFTTGMNMLIDSVFALIAKGISRKEMGTTIKFGLSCDQDYDRSLSQILASALGSYRAMIELCIPDTGTKIIESKSDSPWIFCSAYTKKATSQLPEHFVRESNGVYLLSFRRKNDTTPIGMPDFDNMRKMCDYVSSLIKSGKAASVCSFNGDLFSAVNKMSSDDLELTVLDEKLSLSTLYAEGFIIESSFDVSATKIGIVSKRKTEVLEVTE